MDETQKQDKEALEKLIDRHGLGWVVNTMSEISYEKANHIEEAWQDKHLARVWTKNGSMLDKLASRVSEG